MPVRPQLLDEIEQALGSAISPSLTTSSAVDDLYEAYLFSLVIRAAREEGGSVNYKCINGGSPNPFVFRTSPGYIGSRTHNYGYAEIEFPGCPILEAHVGVRVSGHSNVLHECDVSVLLKDEADVCRAGPDLIAPRSSKLLIAIEAKYYTRDIPLHLGRGFLGLTRDFSTDNVYFVVNRRGRSVEKLLSHKKQLWEHNINPSDPVPVARLRNAFQTAFKDYRARMGV
jgi:hypothetical protein